MPKGHFLHLDPDARSRRDEAVRRMAFEEGRSYNEIAERLGNITSSGVKAILNVQAGNDRKRILHFLETHPDPINSKELAMQLGLDINKTQYIIDNMRKRGMVSADEVKSSGATGYHRHYANIRIKKRQHGKVAATNGHAPATMA